LHSATGSDTGAKLASLIEDILRKSKSENFRTLLFTHRQADLDAMCSASAISDILQRIGSEKFQSIRIAPSIIAPSGASQLTAIVSEKLGIEFDEVVSEEQIRKADLIFVLDTGEPALLGEYSSSIKNSNAPKIVIDHHKHFEKADSENLWKGFDLVVLDSNATSTCEIISLQFDQIAIDRKTATRLMVGLLFDSQHLGIATENTLEAALRLVRTGARIDEAKSLLRNRADRSEVIAKMKSAQRMQFKEIGPYFIALTEVSSFHASVARMLVEIGADLGIAFGKSNGETRISLRSTQKFYNDSKIDLGIALDEIARTVGGTGGGHATAASISGGFDPNSVLANLIERIKLALP
jgi:nanoRNase/pAp phosphatase (c-di-AMP/oligoRNAs hydrolase)